MTVNWSQIKGFNYQPSWGSTGLEIWRNFDADRMGHEIALGKAYFPGMNAIRLWLSHDAWLRDPAGFKDSFEEALTIAANHDLLVMPVFFNRWHCGTLDYGGIYIDHFLPRVSWVQNRDQTGDFVQAILRDHAEDPRILAWDLCNEPFAYSCSPQDIPDIVRAEFAWLERMHGLVKDAGAISPVTVGIHQAHGLEGIRQVDPICDVLSIHPYWTNDRPNHKKSAYEKSLNDYVEFAKESGKPLVATETCWGAIDDAERVEILRYTLGQLKERGIGWFAYTLHHSLIADAHRPEFGPLTTPGNLAFIEADGRLRPGHEAFNDY